MHSCGSSSWVRRIRGHATGRGQVPASPEYARTTASGSWPSRATFRHPLRKSQESLREGIQLDIGDVSGALSKDPVAIARAVNKIFSNRKVTPEVIEELTQTLVQRGMGEDQIRRVFRTPEVTRRLGDMYYEQYVLPSIRGGAAPAYMATQ